MNSQMWDPPTKDAQVDITKTVCFEDDDVLQVPILRPGVRQIAANLTCRDEELDVCVLTTSSVSKQSKKNIQGIKLACCNCGKVTLSRNHSQ